MELLNNFFDAEYSNIMNDFINQKIISSNNTENYISNKKINNYIQIDNSNFSSLSNDKIIKKEENNISRKNNNNYKISEKEIIKVINNRNSKTAQSNFENIWQNNDKSFIKTKYKEIVKNEIKDILFQTELEWGIFNQFDKFVSNNISSPFLESLLEVFFNLYNDSESLEKILSSISQIEYNKIMPYGQVMALAALSNESIAVKMKGIQAFELWNCSDSINALEKVNIGEDWFNLYLNKVINQLKRKS